MARGEHDQPDPSLIIEGSRRPLPSKRIQGHDYPRRLSAEGEIMKKYIGDFTFDDEEYLD